MTPGNPNQDDGGEGKRPNWDRTVAVSPAMRFEMDSAGVGYDDLALKYDERESYGFEPVYPNLKQVLLTEENHPYKEIAHALVTCSAYAYSDSDTLSMIMTRMGLENNRCRMITQCVDAMLIDSTAFLVESDDGEVVILCYRGTQPLSLLNWLVSFDVEHKKIPISIAGREGDFDIHAGFYRNVRATRHRVEDALARALRENESVVKDRLNEKSLKPLKALYITGHSLGGAMAALMAVMLRSKDRYGPIADKLKAVYTFGQPMIGSPEFAGACNDDDFLREKVFRYVYDRDLVPAVPPKQSGDLKHFGHELKWDGKEWKDPNGSTTQASDLQALVGFASFFPFLINQMPGLKVLSDSLNNPGKGGLGPIVPWKISLPVGVRFAKIPVPKTPVTPEGGVVSIPVPKIRNPIFRDGNKINGELNEMEDILGRWTDEEWKKRFPYALKDHLPENYITAFEPPGKSEFGDDKDDR